MGISNVACASAHAEMDEMKMYVCVFVGALRVRVRTAGSASARNGPSR